MKYEDKIAEIMRRYRIIEENILEISPTTSGMTGSFLCFVMNLRLLGPIHKDNTYWLDENFKKPVLTYTEIYSEEYKPFLENLHSEMISNHESKVKQHFNY